VAVATREKPAPAPVPAEDHGRASSSDPAPALFRWLRSPTFALVVILAVAAVLRLVQLGHDSLWIDEVTIAWRSHPHRLLAAVRDAGALEPPASYLVTAPWLQLPISVETAVRLPMALFGVLEVLALYLLARELSRRVSVGLVAALLLAVAPFAVRYSQEARYYVMFSAVHLLSWWLLLRALRRRRTRDWLVLGACNGALLLTHQYAPVVIVVDLVVLAVVAVRERRPGGSQARALVRGGGVSLLTAVVIVAPWLLYSLPTSVSDGTALSPDHANGRGVPLGPDLAKRGAEFLFGNEAHLTALAVVLSALCLAAPFLTKGRDRRVVLAVVGYVVGFAVLLVFVARLLGSYYAFRRVEFLLPLLFVLAAFSIVSGYDLLRRSSVTRSAAGPAIALGVAGVVVLSTLGTVSYYGTEKTNLRAIGELAKDVPPTTIVANFCVTPAGSGPRLEEYAREHGFDGPHVIIDGRHPIPAVTPGETRVLLFSGTPVTSPGWETQALNRLDRLQVVAGDENWGEPVIPLYVARAAPGSDDELASTIATLLTERRCLVDAP